MKTEKNKNKKLNRKLNKKLVYTIIGIIIMLIIGINIVKKVNKNNENTNQAINEIEESQIDFKNLENAEIKENKKINNSKKAHEDKKYEGLKFSNLTLDSTNSETTFIITITNESTKKIEAETLRIVCVNKSGEEIGSLYIAVSELDIGEMINASASISEDLINLYDYKIQSME